MSTESAIKAEERATTPPPNSTTNIARLMSITMMSTRRCSALRPSSAIVSRFDEQHASAIIEARFVDQTPYMNPHPTRGSRGSAMKIGEIAKRTGLKIETFRFYEAEGLVTAPIRSGGNYRLYDRSHLDRLSFIKPSRDLGFTLDQVRSLLRLKDDPRGSFSVAAQLAAVDHKCGGWG